MAPRKINSKVSTDAPPIRKTRGRAKKIQSPPSIQIEIPVQRSVEVTRKRTKKCKLPMEKQFELGNEVIHTHLTRSIQIKNDPIEAEKPPAIIIDTTTVPNDNEVTRKRTKKCKLSMERQIELANEVIHTQLARRVQIKSDPIETEKPPAIIIDATTVPNDNEVDDKAPVRKLVRKRPNNKIEPIEKPNINEIVETIAKPTISRKRAADSTQQPAKKRKVCAKNTAPQKPKKETKPSAAAKGNSIPKKRKFQGKKKNDGVNAVLHSLPALDEAVEIKDVIEPTAAVIDSRKTSATSASNFSWTKDISSSSTTTCVTVATNDFVRIDKKIPVIQLTNVDSELQKYKRCESDDSSSESDSSSSSDSVSNVSICVPTISLNLSTSSPSICQGNTNCTPKSDPIISNINKALVKMSLYLKKFDKEMTKWIGYSQNIDDTKKMYNDLILTVLKQEKVVITKTRHLICLFSPKEPDDVDTDGEFNSVVTNNFNTSYDDDNPITKDNVLLNENVEYPRSPKSPSTAYDSDYVLDNLNYSSFERNNDDDDALSLFAESITGIEPSRTNNSSDSPDVTDVMDDEYVPQPMNRDTSSAKYEYRPTKVPRQDEAVKKNVCEKQNADSTSIHKEGNVENISHGDVEECISGPSASYDGKLEEGELANTEVLPNQIGPPQVTSIFQHVPWKRTTIFRGLCFFNLMNACKRKQPYCPYPHVVPNPVEIKTRLARLSERMFIEEYIFLSSHPMLRRRYGFYFVEECHRRGMPRVLVEIAIDFVVNVVIKTKEDSDYQLSTLEYILLSLNDVGLAVCEDLLSYPVDGDTRLCHVLIRVIADSQNFSRFKQVFLNLTNLMVRHQQTFDSDIAEQILERVCILPAEERLLRAVFDIIKHTDTCIFANSMMCTFETRLRTVNSAMYEELMAYKNEKLDTSVVSKKDLEPLNINCINDDDKERYTSPDTTKADTLQNRPSLDTSITRTVNLTRTCYNNKFSSTPTKHNVEDWLNNDFRSWRQSSPRAPVPLMSMPLVRPVRPRIGRQVKVYRTPPTSYRPRPPRNF